MFLAVAALLVAAGPALAQAPPKSPVCRMGLIAELPVTFKHNRPTVPIEVDGRHLNALVDSGASITIIFADVAQKLGIATRQDPRFRSFGADGEGKVSMAHVTLGMMGAKGPAQDIMVTGKASSGEDMLLGEDILSQAVLEMDLAHSKIRLLHPDHCGEEDMAYWAQSYSEAVVADGPGHHIRLSVMLNGTRIPAILDSGASTSIATESAAFQAGVSLPPLTGAAQSRGVNGVAFETRHGRVNSVQVGDEKIGSTFMRFGPLFRRQDTTATGTRVVTDENYEMLLGADFLRSHRVLVDRDHGKMYFTYNGGPVFLPDSPPAPPAAPSGDAPRTAPPAAGTPP